MTALSVTPLTDTTVDLWGKDCDDLQENIVVGSNSISGTLKYVDDYSSAFGPGLDSGNYIVLKCEVPDVEDVTITFTVTNPVTLDPDGINVARIADKDTQTITITASKEGYESYTKVYTLTNIVCEDSVG